MYAPLSPELLPAAADSARVAVRLYNVSLSELFPLAIAGSAAFVLRNSQAATRVAIWRAAIVAMFIVVCVGFLPFRIMMQVIPAGLATPFVLLGRMQLSGPTALVPVGGATPESFGVRLLVALYVAGVLVVLLPFVAASLRLSRVIRRSGAPADARITNAFDRARAEIGVAGSVRLVVSNDITVPMTWGFFRPTILLPAAFIGETDRRIRAVLLHELQHVRSHDVAFAAASRFACALLWFHPCAWVIARQFHAECEIACDDRVLAAGVRQTDYAALLVDACDDMTSARQSAALAVTGRVGLRGRLDSILDPLRDRRLPSRVAGSFAMVLTLAVAVPAGMIQYAPNKSVLNSLMRDQRWESRAYAVLGLAQRPDSIEVARSAAATDPDPKVRAWARYAVSLESAGVRAIHPFTAP